MFVYSPTACFDKQGFNSDIALQHRDTHQRVVLYMVAVHRVSCQDSIAGCQTDAGLDCVWQAPFAFINTTGLEWVAYQWRGNREDHIIRWCLMLRLHLAVTTHSVYLHALQDISVRPGLDIYPLCFGSQKRLCCTEKSLKILLGNLKGLVVIGKNDQWNVIYYMMDNT